MDELVVNVEHLKKYFFGRHGTVRAVDGVDLQVARGEIFGFLGPNGAGKTTTLRILTTLMVPDSGQVLVAGHDVLREPGLVRQQIGYVSQVGGADRSATGRENLVLQGQLYGMTTPGAACRAAELMKLLDLEDFADRLVSTFSGGQRRRLDVALGLMNRPQVLFLDEPTTGLDPQNRANLWEQIRDLRRLGTTIFLTTHYMDEADALCDRLAVIDYGRIVAEGTPSELKKQVSGDCVVINIEDAKAKAPPLLDQLAKLDLVSEVYLEGESIRLSVQDGAKVIASILRLLEQQHVNLAGITLSTPSLDDFFLQKTGRYLRDAHTDATGEAVQ